MAVPGPYSGAEGVALDELELELELDIPGFAVVISGATLLELSPPSPLISILQI